MNLTTDQLRESFQKRPGANTKIIVKDKIDFAPFEETIVFDNNKLISAVRVPYRLRPSDMKTPGLLRDLGLIAKDGASQEEKSDPVYTLEDEIERLQKKLPDDIAKAAKDAAEALKGMKDNDKRVLVKKTFLPYSYDSVLEKEKTAEYDAVSGADLDALVKRAVIRKTLVNLAWNVKLVESLHDEAEKATGAKLDEMLDDALQRRMVYDLLAPINVFWPGDLGDFKKLKDFETLKDGDVKDKLLAEVIEKHKTERLADIVKQPMESVKALLDQRLKASISDTYDKEMHIGEHWPDGMKRTSVEKRRKISFILFALSQVSVPTLEKKLYDKGLERAQMVCGLYECTSAMVYYTRTQRVLQERYESAIKADRDGTLTLVKDGKFVAMPSLGGFPAEFEELINRLVTLKSRIDDADLRLKDLKEQRDKFQITHDERARQHRDALDRLLRARESTKKDLARLTELQDQLHDAHLQLSEAGKRNEELVREIEELTRRYVEEDRRLEALQKKGKKRP
jgi:hypothetical protein